MKKHKEFRYIRKNVYTWDFVLFMVDLNKIRKMKQYCTYVMSYQKLNADETEKLNSAF